MRILFIQLLVPVACYFLGVFVGMKVEQRICLDDFDKIVKDRVAKKLAEDDCIQHVGYTMEQCGYDK